MGRGRQRRLPLPFLPATGGREPALPPQRPQEPEPVTTPSRASSALPASEQQAQPPPPTSRQLGFAVPVLPWRRKSHEATRGKRPGPDHTAGAGGWGVEGDRTRPAKRAGPAPTFQPQLQQIRAMLSMQSPTSRGPDQRGRKRVSSGPSAPCDHQPSPKSLNLCLQNQKLTAESLGQSKQIPGLPAEAPWVRSHEPLSLLETGASRGPGL